MTQDDEPGVDRLDSWKEIACFLKRSVRTVQRWEMTEGLPVHRHLHEKKCTVYAHRGELEVWLEQRRSNLSQPSAPTAPRASEIPRPNTATIPSLPTESLEAYRMYLKGRRSCELRTKLGFERGIEYFNHAIQEDPEFALAFAGIADCWNMLGFHSFLSPASAFQKARAAAREALALSENSAEAWTALGFTVLFFDWDSSSSRGNFRKALEIRPDYAPAHYWYGLNLAALRRSYEAIQHVRRAQELDPLSPIVNTYVAGAFYFARQFEEAEAKCRLALEIDPQFVLARLVLGWVLRQEARYDLAVEELRKASGTSGDYVDGLAALGHCLGIAGYRAEAVEVLDDLKQMSETRFVSSGHFALVLLGLGKHEEAVRQLAEAFRERYPWLVFLRLDPIFDPLRCCTAFSDLVEEGGF